MQTDPQFIMVVMLGLGVMLGMSIMSLVTDAIQKKHQERHAVLQEQMRALQAVDRLSQLAWQTRVAMHETMMAERRGGRPGDEPDIH